MTNSKEEQPKESAARRGPGRPPTGNALSPADKQRNYRKRLKAKQLSFEHFLKQAQTLTALIKASDLYGWQGVVEKSSPESVQGGLEEGWQSSEYYSWGAGYFAAACQLGALTPEQQNSLVDIIKGAVENIQ